VARTPLNKAELARKKRQLATYQRFLPSLDMKRKQLMAERRRARQTLADLRADLAETRRQAGETLPMLADEQVDVERLLRVSQVQLGRQNVVGVALPTLDDVHFARAAYGYLAKPHWVDPLVELLESRLRLEIAERIAAERLRLLEEALKKVTQRVNLFDKVLIPRTQEEIKHIQIALGDAERAAVVRAKFAKRKRAEAGS
jgi:V/A-type H+-transporting ATPase subunit D